MSMSNLRSFAARTHAILWTQERNIRSQYVEVTILIQMPQVKQTRRHHKLACEFWGDVPRLLDIIAVKLLKQLEDERWPPSRSSGYGYPWGEYLMRPIPAKFFK